MTLDKAGYSHPSIAQTDRFSLNLDRAAFGDRLLPPGPGTKEFWVGQKTAKGVHSLLAPVDLETDAGNVDGLSG